MRYSENHIITLKIEFQYGSMMKKMDKINKAVEMFKIVEIIVTKILKEKELNGQKL